MTAYQCLKYGHEFNKWSLWVAERAVIDWSKVVVDEAPSNQEPLRAQRERTCMHCGLRQFQERNTGKITERRACR